MYDDAALGTARLGPTGDVTAPGGPGSSTATATSPFSVQVDWTPASDDVGVTGYDVMRDASLVASLGAAASYTDLNVAAGSTHTYAVRARDAAGNVSVGVAAAPVTTPTTPLPLFADGFETGNLSAWTTTGGLTVSSSDVRNGGFAAEGNTTNGGAFAKRTLGGTYADAYARVGFEVKSQSADLWKHGRDLFG